MDDLEITCEQLKSENEKLRQENALLKEKSQLLIDENRKLLKFKLDTESQPKPIILQPIQTVNIEPTNAKPFLEADESAVFTKYASQPKRQLQGMFQQVIYMLILQTLGLIRRELSSSAGTQTSKIKLVKLKSNLSRLVKMANARRPLLPKPEKSIQIMNTYKINKPVNVSSMKLALLLSLIFKTSEVKKVKKLF